MIILDCYIKGIGYLMVIRVILGSDDK